MKAIKYSLIALAIGMGTAACTDLDEKVCIVYSPNPNSRVILRSAIYRTLMASVSAIISDAFKIPVDDIRLLHDEKDPLFQNNT